MNTPDINIQKIETAMDSMRAALTNVRERFIEGLQLTRTQIEILIMVGHQRSTTGELAKRLFLTQSAVTQTIDSLVRRDLVERTPDEHDGRVTRIALSPDGRVLTTQLLELKRQHMHNLVGVLTQDEIDAFVSITGKLTALLTNPKTTPKLT